MDVKTYILYDKLLDQQAELTATVTELEVSRTLFLELSMLPYTDCIDITAHITNV
jgi:hypothetical protein